MQQNTGNRTAQKTRDEKRIAILDLISRNALTVFFQPIYAARTGMLHGYEALTRIQAESSFPTISDLFRQAKQTDIISTLDVYCRENAIRNAVAQGIRDRNALLFINICPETLIDAAHKNGLTEEYIERWGLKKEQIILEITEESAIQKFELFKKAVDYYRQRGYKIAIDDFGAGYGGMKMLSIIEPDFIKIDRHFISQIDRTTVKYNLVDCIVTACHRMGIQIIAEGIEREEEMIAVLNMDIEFFQGYYLSHPSPALNGKSISVPCMPLQRIHPIVDQFFVGAIAQRVEPICPQASVMEAFNRFMKQPGLRSLPVVKGTQTIGMLHRSRFLENQILGKYGYGFALNQYKTVEERMERQFLMIESSITLEEAAQRIQSRKAEVLYEDICITRNGNYFGTLPINILLDAITERSIRLAKGANPLTGLPGNEFIQREINRKLAQNMHFDICYIDIDNFKPYNDHYGFEKGDTVIKTLGDILIAACRTERSGFHFTGHIGGDDFIVITRPQDSLAVCTRIISDFDASLPLFHGQEDFQQGRYSAFNRKGLEEIISLLSLSIGIVSTEFYKITSYAQLASIATEVKKAAKAQAGSSIVRDRRTLDFQNVFRAHEEEAPLL
ncbi:MAG: GGDEF domain-containing protein [Nitrospirota bacterium]